MLIHQGMGQVAGCRIGLAAAPMVVDGAVITGSTGGMLRIFDNAAGAVLLEYQTNKPYANTATETGGRAAPSTKRPMRQSTERCSSNRSRALRPAGRECPLGIPTEEGAVIGHRQRQFRTRALSR